MRLERLTIERIIYGAHEGKYRSRLRFVSDTAAIEREFGPEFSDRILALVGDALVAEAAETADLLRSRLLEHMQSPQLENPHGRS